MPSYLVESYAPATPEALAEQRRRALRAGELAEGVRYVRTTFVPGDETIMHLFEAPSADALDRAGRLAELPFERIVEAVEDGDLAEAPS